MKLEMRNGKLDQVGSGAPGNSFAKQFPQQPGAKASDPWSDPAPGSGRMAGELELDNPAATSPDGTYIAAAAAPAADFDDYAPKDTFVVLNVRDSGIFWKRTFAGDIDAVSWSPDGSAVAVLLTAEVAKPRRGAKDFVVGAFGWKISHKRAWLEIFDAKGTLHCKADMYPDLMTPSNFLSWPSSLQAHATTAVKFGDVPH